MIGVELIKWYSYIIARTFLKFNDEAEKRRRNKEVQTIKDSEEKFDKGYWKYNFTMEDYLFVEPKKNEHFVTTEINNDEKVCNIILSKKPVSLESENYDYPWEAEAFCRIYADINRRQGYKVTVKREAPILIADYDICCPYCFNSSTLENWMENSYKQELLEQPEYYKQLNIHIIKDEKITIDDINTEKVWCPICNNGIENREILMTKGNEWKVGFIKNTLLPKYTSPFLEKLMKENEAHSFEILQKIKEPGLFDIFSVVDADRKVITNPEKMVTENAYGGLVVRVVEKVIIKNGEEIQKTKWIQMKNSMPLNCEIMKDISTSYAVSADLKWMYKRDKWEFPIIYVPLSELVIRNYDKKTITIFCKKRLKNFILANHYD